MLAARGTAAIACDFVNVLLYRLAAMVTAIARVARNRAITYFMSTFIIVCHNSPSFFDPTS